MKFLHLTTLPIGLAAIAIVALAGCGGQADPPASPPAGEASTDPTTGEPIHGGWWCHEHAIPEEQCAMCDTKLAAELREKGDWCDEHNRPDSLCFKCDPSRADKFVALYEAKYGKKPPKATD